MKRFTKEEILRDVTAVINAIGESLFKNVTENSYLMIEFEFYDTIKSIGKEILTATSLKDLNSKLQTTCDHFIESEAIMLNFSIQVTTSDKEEKTKT